MLHNTYRFLAGRMFVLRDGELEAEMVDGRHVLPSEVLQHSGQERLSEVESRDPEYGRSATEDPLLDSSKQIKSNLVSKLCLL